MIPLDTFKQLLGPVAETLSEEEILKVRDDQERIADIIFDTWLRHRIKAKE